MQRIQIIGVLTTFALLFGTGAVLSGTDPCDGESGDYFWQMLLLPAMGAGAALYFILPPRLGVLRGLFALMLASAVAGALYASAMFGWVGGCTE